VWSEESNSRTLLLFLRYCHVTIFLVSVSLLLSCLHPFLPHSFHTAVRLDALHQLVHDAGGLCDGPGDGPVLQRPCLHFGRTRARLQGANY